MSFHRAALFVAMLTVACGCSKPLDPKPAPITITQATFEPVYRASKTIQGSTGPGVTFMKFGELLQAFSTEISIAKDHQMNDIDKILIGKYDAAMAAYQFSGLLWKTKNERHEDYWEGFIPVGIGGNYNEGMAEGIAAYHLTVRERTIKSIGRGFQGVDGDAIQQVWLKADEILKSATEMYYGRTPAAPAAKETP